MPNTLTSKKYPKNRELNIENIVLKSVFNNSHLNFNFAHLNPGSLKPHLHEITEIFSDVNCHPHSSSFSMNKVTTKKRSLQLKVASGKLSLKLPPKTLWKNIRKLGITTGKTENVSAIEPNEFNEYFSSIFTPQTFSDSHLNVTQDDNRTFEFETVSAEEVYYSINKITSNAIAKSNAIVIARKPVNNIPALKLGSDIIEYSSKVKSLGVIINQKLTWNDHIHKICCDVKAGIGMLSQTKHFTPRETKLGLVKSLLIPRFDYCSNIYLGASRADWKEIESAYNSCVRYIFDKKRYESVSRYKSHVVGSSIENLLKYRACLFIYNLLRYKQPEYLYEKIIFTKSSRNRVLQTPSHLRSQFSNSFFVLGIQIWNSIKSDIRMANSTSVFKTKCLSYFNLQRLQE
ncbi:CLUMA_CG019164, isoform A [Clunio marinus]|uniref:CLUMA_CG019164, isoform A n=1 Tax=Clunio marinus TaxID=568069 RepID=A0A1J1J048_9DIPT|nr:CLUMA_CG019164, isoform A [Clunio marinus]